ncbi:MAG: periplasmic heavy metal sensor [Planctomycetota bacterium]
MRNKLLLVILTLSLGLNIAFMTTCAVRQFGGGGCIARRPPPEGHNEEIWSPLHRELGVTEEQWEEIEPRLREFQRKLQTRHRRIQKVRKGMLEVLSAPEVDRKAIEKQQKKVLRAFRKTQDLMLEHILTERKLLTPEQQERLFRMLRRRMQAAGPGRPKGGPGVGKAFRGLEKWKPKDQ